MQNVLRIVLLFAMAVALPLSAQHAPPLGAAGVTLIAGINPARGGRTEVVRRATRTPQNLVIVDRNATAEDLAAALAMVTALRATYGDSLTTDLRARPESMRSGPTWQNSAYRSWLIQQLVRLRTAPQDTFPGIGFVRSVQVTLRAPTRRVTASPGGRD